MVEAYRWVQPTSCWKYLLSFASSSPHQEDTYPYDWLVVLIEPSWETGYCYHVCTQLPTKIINNQHSLRCRKNQPLCFLRSWSAILCACSTILATADEKPTSLLGEGDLGGGKGETFREDTGLWGGDRGEWGEARTCEGLLDTDGKMETIPMPVSNSGLWVEDIVACSGLKPCEKSCLSRDYREKQTDQHELNINTDR